MKVGVIGAGRIGKVHAKNIAQFVPELQIKTIADPFANDETRAFAQRYNIPNVATDAEAILNDDEIEYLNNYHRCVFDSLRANLSETEREWLKEATRSI